MSNITLLDAPIWIETPLIRSQPLSSKLGCHVYLKLENLQISGSFKGRGVSKFAEQAKAIHGSEAHLVIASGGNAGLAAATAARQLGLKCTVYLPRTSLSMIELLTREGAETVIDGKNYDEALQSATKATQDMPHAVLVPAYDHDLVMKGHGTMVQELVKQLPKATQPDAIFCSVGGGGLLGGLIMGCQDAGWESVPIIAMETHGSNCFYHSLLSNIHVDRPRTIPEGSIQLQDEEFGISFVRLGGIRSRATSLGARSPAPAAVKMALERRGGIKVVSLSDERSMQAALEFAADHRILVELACSTTLAAAYSSALFEKIMGPPRPERIVIFIVCGGTKISLPELNEYDQIIGANLSLARGEVWIDGEVVDGV